ncbi:ABC transporter substrate-binding protein [Nonomuraea typhae]|uniref:ABC transporter substrate-binding protein n=1 Tax=Nonomuraea typhae TaxID=2603600 RepID=UPI0012FA03F0|nr:extracellular solute-binding protein [Nonomuraea typhae]
MRRGVALAVGIGVALLGSACGGRQKAPETASGPVTVTVNGLPPATDTYNRANFEADVKAFEAKFPNIKIDAKEGLMDPQTFSAKIAGGQLEDVFYVYLTDAQNLIAKRQVSDIGAHLGEFPTTKDYKPGLMQVFSDQNGKVYGLPDENYSLGLLYNRKLFTKAGLDPAQPPATWAEVREQAKKLAALGGGVVGYGDYSKSNTGGWHFTAEIYSLGGDVAVKSGDGWKAAFNSPQGRQVLQQLKDMRWSDDTMGQRQLLEYDDLVKLMATDKLGMYIGSTGDLANIVNRFKGTFADFGLGPIPDGKGTLGGGSGYMFKAGLSPEKIKAGLAWLTFKKNPDRIDADNAKAAAKGQPVGLPEPNVWTGASEQKLLAATKKHATIPTENFAAFAAAMSRIPVKLEPPNAQQIYAVLDTAMGKVLTDRDADVDALLAAAEKQVNQILATVK